MNEQRPSNQNVCYCGEYGGGVHTKSARCSETKTDPIKCMMSLNGLADGSLDESKYDIPFLARFAVKEIEFLQQELARTESARVAILAENTHYKQKVTNLLDTVNAKQAKIDALMLEFCPGEMPAEQRAEYTKHQRAADEPPAVPQSLNEWFCALPAGRQAVLASDKWMLAEAAYQAGRVSSPPADVQALKSALRSARSVAFHEEGERFVSLVKLIDEALGEVPPETKEDRRDTGGICGLKGCEERLPPGKFICDKHIAGAAAETSDGK